MSGQEIQQYLAKMVEKYQLRPYIKLQHRLTSARYIEETGKWDLTIKRHRHPQKELNRREGQETYDTSDWEEFHDTTDILFCGIGALNRWTWPDISGLEEFSGKVVHTAQWDSEDDKEFLGDKRVAVIGIVSGLLCRGVGKFLTQ